MIYIYLYLVLTSLFSQNLKDDGLPYFVPQRANIFIDNPKFSNFYITFRKDTIPFIKQIGNTDYSSSLRFECLGNTVVSNYNTKPLIINSLNHIYNNNLKSIDFFAYQTLNYRSEFDSEVDMMNKKHGYYLLKNDRVKSQIMNVYCDVNAQRNLTIPISKPCNFINFYSILGDVSVSFIDSIITISPVDSYKFEDEFLIKYKMKLTKLYNKSIDFEMDNIEFGIMKDFDNEYFTINTMLAGVQHKNKKDYWVIYHKELSDFFSVHKIQTDGKIDGEIRNKIGVDYSKPFRNGDTSDIEQGLYFDYLKPSPNGKILAQTQQWGEQFDMKEKTYIKYAKYFEKRNILIFKFDNEFGKISDEIIMNRTAHSIEYSPNSRYLYITSIDGMYVYDLIEWDRDKIIQSEKKVDDFRLWSSIFLGPYGKMWGFNYMSDTLMCIQNPNNFDEIKVIKYPISELDADSDNSKTILSDLMKSGAWLPIMPNNLHYYPINDYYNNINIIISGEGKYCLNENLTLTSEVENYKNDMTAYWVKPNGEKVLTIDLTIDSLTLQDSGYYKFILESFCDESKIYDSVLVNVFDLSPVITANQTTFCEDDSAKLSLDFEYENIIWNTGEKSKEIIVKEEGVYSATITENNCVNYAELSISTYPLPTIEILAPNGTIICNDEELEIEAKVPANTSIIWNDGTRLSKRTFSESGTYTVTAKDLSTGCENKKEVVISDIGNTEIQILGKTTFCNGESTTLTIDAQAEKYIWNTGEITQSIIVNEAGIYSATISTETGCKLFAEIEVFMFDNPEFEILGNLVFCGENTTIYPNNEFIEYIWSTGESSKSITISEPGKYNLTVKNENGCETTKEFEVVKTDSELNLSTNNIDFGEVIYGESKNQTINSDKDLILVDDNDIFTIEIENKNINIEFSPSNIGELVDTLIIESNDDCKTQGTIIVNGTAKAEIMAKVSENEGRIGDTINTIVELELMQEIPLPIEIKYNLVLEVNQNVIQIIDNTNFDYQNQKLVINIDDLVNMTTHKQAISNIQSTIQNNEPSKNDIVIKNFSVDNKYLITSIKDGKVNVLESNPDDYKESEIIELTKTNLTLKTYEEGLYKIEISDLKGKRIYLDESISKSEIIKFNYDLINGTYFIKVIEPGKTKTIKVNFVE